MISRPASPYPGLDFVPDPGGYHLAGTLEASLVCHSVPVVSTLGPRHRG